MPPCCASATALPDTLTNVKKYYGETLKTSKDLKTSACTAAGRPHPEVVNIMRQVPDEIKAKFYGCGAPLPLGIDGLRVLDLGSGSGRDCYIASKLVGEKGAHAVATASWRCTCNILVCKCDAAQSEVSPGRLQLAR
jgi:hypothetical protein